MKEQQKLYEQLTADHQIITRKEVDDDLPEMLQLFTATIDIDNVCPYQL